MSAAATVATAVGLLAALGVLAWTSATVAAGSPGAPGFEVARLLRQPRRRTVSADRLLWRSASAGLLPVAALMLAFVPWGGAALVSSPVGLVWVNALDVVVWALVWLLGWGPNAVGGLVGSHRFLSLALGYELPLMFALVAPATAARSLDLATVAQAQAGLWYVVWMPVAFAVYCLGVLGFAMRGPFASPTGPDVGGGVLGELSGPDRLLAAVGRHALLGAGAAVAVPLFLGGGAGPLLPGAAWVLVKAVALTAGLAWLADRLPAVPPQRLLERAWTVVLPLVVLQDLVVAVVAQGGWLPGAGR